MRAKEKKGKCHQKAIRIQNENKQKRGKNAGDQDVFDFSFASDWLRE